jgi:hypothetical protein
MAVVLLGGLITAAFLSLFVLPALYLGFGRGTARGPAAGDGDELLRRWVGTEPAREREPERPPAAAAEAVDGGREPAA